MARKVLVVFFLFVVAAAVSAQSRARGEQFALNLTGNVVGVWGLAEGFGFIVAERNGALLVVTPAHVLLGEGTLRSPRLVRGKAGEAIAVAIEKGEIPDSLLEPLDLDKKKCQLVPDGTDWRIEAGERAFKITRSGNDIVIKIAHAAVSLPGSEKPIRSRPLREFASSCEGDLDLAFLEVDVPPEKPRWKKAALGQTRRLRRGSELWFVGLGLEWQVPSEPGHVVSADASHIGGRQISIDGLSVMPGNSGAPVVDDTGIVGMLVIHQASAIARAVPIDEIQKQLRAWSQPWDLYRPVRLAVGALARLPQFLFFDTFPSAGVVTDGKLYGGAFLRFGAEVGSLQLITQGDICWYLAGAGVYRSEGLQFRLRGPWRLEVQPGIEVRHISSPEYAGLDSLTVSLLGAAEVELAKGLTLLVSAGAGLGGGEIARGLEEGIIPMGILEVSLRYDIIPLAHDLFLARP